MDSPADWPDLQKLTEIERLFIAMNAEFFIHGLLSNLRLISEQKTLVD